MTEKLIEKLPFKDLVIRDDWNSRTLDMESSGTDDQSFSDLVQSISEKGQEQPVKVRPIKGGKYELVAGFRRAHALLVVAENRLEKNPTIRAIVREMTDIEAIEANALENAQEPLRPADKCFSIGRLSDALSATGKDLDQATLATRVGMSQGFASKMLTIWKGLTKTRFAEWRAMKAPIPYPKVVEIAKLRGTEQTEAWVEATRPATEPTESSKKKKKLEKLCKEAERVGAIIGRLERAECIKLTNAAGIAEAMWGDVEGLTPTMFKKITDSCSAGYTAATKVTSEPVGDGDDDDGEE